MPVRRDVEVEIEFLPTELGGRRNGVRTGYRPQLYYDGQDWDALHEYPDVEEVRPGEHVRAYLTCLSPQFHDKKLVPGRAVLFRERHRVVAFGTVTRVIDLPGAAYRARVDESLDLYYRALGLTLEQAASSNDETLCRTELGLALSVRQQLQAQTELPDLQTFLSRQVALSGAITAATSEMTTALDGLKIAITGSDSGSRNL
jgi:hypothetical protein